MYDPLTDMDIRSSVEEEEITAINQDEDDTVKIEYMEMLLV